MRLSKSRTNKQKPDSKRKCQRKKTKPKKKQTTEHPNKPQNYRKVWETKWLRNCSIWHNQPQTMAERQKPAKWLQLLLTLCHLIALHPGVMPRCASSNKWGPWPPGRHRNELKGMNMFMFYFQKAKCIFPTNPKKSCLQFGNLTKKKKF